MWSQSSKECQVQLKHTVAEAFKIYCKKENITYSVVLADMQAAIENEHVHNDEIESNEVQYTDYSSNNTVQSDSAQQDYVNYRPTTWRTNAPKFNYMKYNRFKDVSMITYNAS